MAADNAKNKGPASKGPVKKKKISDEFNEGDIFEAPTITREPSSRQARLGSNVVIRITASGRPLPSYQWYHNGKKISGANTDRLNLNKCRRSHAGAYHCEAKNHTGKAVSRQCMLSFFTQTIPKLVIDPAEVNVEEGKPFVLKVREPNPGAFKDYKVFWVFNGMRIKGAHGLELKIAAGKKKYEGEYKAMISVGSGIETSNICKITIVPPKPASQPPPLPKPEEISKADHAQEDGTMVGMLSPTELSATPSAVSVTPSDVGADPLALIEAAKAKSGAEESKPPAPSASDWAESVFNPDDEAITAQDLPDSDKPEDSTREFNSRKVKVSKVDSDAAMELSQLLEVLPEEAAEEPADDMPSPLDVIERSRLITALEEPAELPEMPVMPEPDSDPSSLIEEWTNAGSKTIEADPDPMALIQEAETSREIVKLIEVPTRARPLPSPRLRKKQVLLENMLARWQARMGKSEKQAA